MFTRHHRLVIILGLVIILVFIFLQSARAQDFEPTIYADLTGEWRINNIDDPRFMDVELDDTSWRTIRLPLAEPLPAGTWWLRKSVYLPAIPKLALALGELGDSCEVFIDGVRLTRFGPRPQSHDLPPVNGRLVIAIRVSRISAFATERDYGPYVITHPSLAATLAAKGNYDSGPRQLGGTLIAFQPIMALVLICVWFARRRRSELLYFSAWLMASALIHSFTSFVILYAVCFSLIFPEFTLTALQFHRPKWRVWFWPATCILAIAATLDDSARLFIIRYANAAAIVCLFFAARAVWAGPARRRLLAIPIGIQALNELNPAAELTVVVSAIIAAFLIAEAFAPKSPFAIESMHIPTPDSESRFQHILPVPDDGVIVAVGEICTRSDKDGVARKVSDIIRQVPDEAPHGVLNAVNRALAGTLDGGFVTCLLARISGDGSCAIATAGHTQPEQEDGTPMALRHAMPLGLLAAAEYQSTDVNAQTLSLGVGIVLRRRT